MFEFREMTAEEVPAVVAIISAHSRADGRMAAAYYAGYFADDARVRSPRERNIVGLMAAERGIAGVIGFCPDKYDCPDMLWLNWFYVAEKYRGRGLGTALLDRAIGEARELGTRKLYLDTSSDASYKAAVRLYGRFGFREEGKLLDYYVAGEDCLILGLEL